MSQPLNWILDLESQRDRTQPLLQLMLPKRVQKLLLNLKTQRSGNLDLSLKRTHPGFAIR